MTNYQLSYRAADVAARKKSKLRQNATGLRECPNCGGWQIAGGKTNA